LAFSINFFKKIKKIETEAAGEYPAAVIEYAAWRKLSLNEADVELKNLNKAIDSL